MNVRSNPSMAGQMGARLVAGGNRGAWVGDRAGVTPRKQARAARLMGAAVGSIHVVIVSMLFLVLFATTLMVGGHAAIDPLVEAVMESQQGARDTGAVVYTMPDGVFCRHVSFDNVTAQMVEGSIQRCQDDLTIARERARPHGAFSWQMK